MFFFYTASQPLKWSLNGLTIVQPHNNNNNSFWDNCLCLFLFFSPKSHSLSVVLILVSVPAGFTPLWLPQMECDDKEMRREISYAIKNIHGIRYMFVCRCLRPPNKCFILKKYFRRHNCWCNHSYFCSLTRTRFSLVNVDWSCGAGIHEVFLRQAFDHANHLDGNYTMFQKLVWPLSKSL